MRNLRFLLLAVVLGAFLGLPQTSQAQSIPPPPTMPTMANGVLGSASATTVTIKPDSPGLPSTFSCSKFTRFEDDKGNPLAVATLQPGAAVTVYFGRDRYQEAALRIVVHGI